MGIFALRTCARKNDNEQLTKSTESQREEGDPLPTQRIGNSFRFSEAAFQQSTENPNPAPITRVFQQLESPSQAPSSPPTPASKTNPFFDGPWLRLELRPNFDGSQWTASFIRNGYLENSGFQWSRLEGEATAQNLQDALTHAASQYLEEKARFLKKKTSQNTPPSSPDAITHEWESLFPLLDQLQKRQQTTRIDFYKGPETEKWQASTIIFGEIDKSSGTGTYQDVNPISAARGSLSTAIGIQESSHLNSPTDKSMTTSFNVNFSSGSDCFPEGVTDQASDFSKSVSNWYFENSDNQSNGTRTAQY